MKYTLAIITVIILSSLSGCRNDSTTNSDENEIKYDSEYFKSIATNNEEYGDFAALDDVSGDDSEEPFSAKTISSVFGNKTFIQPLKFRKQITNVVKNYYVDSLGDSARILNIFKTISGNFILTGIRNDTDTVTVQKPFTHSMHRDIEFRRIARKRFPRMNWKPYSITVGAGSTSMAQDSFSIAQLYVQIEDGDTCTINRPADEYRFYFGPNGTIPHAHKDDTVTVRLTIESVTADTEIVALRVGRGRRANFHKRQIIPLVSQTVNSGVYTRTYEKVFEVHHGDGRFNAVFEAMSHNSLYDDGTSKFTSEIWSLPYRIEHH
ncbi:MAG: hypothetical protein FJ218_01470 [Ignavibacteria bacterium]|nr:hypothetical protein [Ignavibacteria bacterium]